MTPGRNSLESIIRRCGIELTRGQFDSLWHYHQLLRRANAELNLTRIHQFENMVLKHYVDSLLVLNFINLPSPIVDMGSGPGLPGIPLKIARPDVSMILAEPRGARAEFLQRTCDTLGLNDVEVFANKVGSKFPHQVQGVITRAVASIPETLERVARCIVPGGRMIFMKGPDCEDEIREATQSHGETFRLSSDDSYSIPGTSHDRRLVVYERTKTVVSFDEHAPDTESSAIRPKEITSEANPAFKLMRELQTGKGIRKNGQAILSGPRVVAEMVARHPERIEAWITPADDATAPPIERPDLSWLRLAKPLFAEIDVAGTHSPLLLVRIPQILDWSPDSPWPDGCTLFIPFQDPENVGALIRSAAAFEVPRVVLLKEAAHPFHPKSVRAAGSALFQVELLAGPSIRDLASTEIPLIPLHASGAPIDSRPFPASFGLVPGLEGPGLPDQLRSLDCRSIPISPNVESLNAATATAIALFAWKHGRDE